MSVGRRPWREAAREVMHAAALREAALSPLPTEGFRYRWEHVQAVAATALRLAALSGADIEVAEAAAWLHDVCKTDPHHAQRGADFARDFLPTTDFPPAKVEAVARAIADHEGLWRTSPLEDLDSQVLWDADKLTKIGLLGALHSSSGRVAAGGGTTEELLARAQAIDWRERAAASMHLAPARQAAAARVAATRAYWSQVAAEWSAIDLGAP
jgi:uncharacterized protein